MKTTARIIGFIFVVVVSGAFVGCSDDDGGGSLSPNGVATDYCEKYQECDPTGFAEDYQSISECAGDMVSEYNADVAEFGQACGDAELDFADCVTHQTCNPPQNACSSEINAVDTLCQGEVDSPCPGYVAGSDDDYCCQTDDPCGWAEDDWCDCDGTCAWDGVDCAE